MNEATRWSRILVIAGLVAMLIGAVDPLEGSLLILPGSALVALGALLGKSRHRRFLYWSLVFVAVGVGGLWGLLFRGAPAFGWVSVFIWMVFAVAWIYFYVNRPAQA